MARAAQDGKAELGPAACSRCPPAVEWAGVLERQLPAHGLVQGRGGAASAVCTADLGKSALFHVFILNSRNVYLYSLLDPLK